MIDLLGFIAVALLVGGLVSIHLATKRARQKQPTPTRDHASPIDALAGATPSPAPAPSAPVPPARHSSPEQPSRFGLVTDRVVKVRSDLAHVFVDSRGISISIVTPKDQPAFAITHDDASQQVHRSPDLPTSGGWGDWLITLTEIRDTGFALSEITVGDLRAIDAFIEYGRSRRAYDNGAHR